MDEEITNALVDYRQLPEEIGNNVEFKRIIEALNTLPGDQQELLHWRFVDNLPIKEIAELSGKKSNAIYVSIYRGTQKLKRLFNKHV